MTQTARLIVHRPANILLVTLLCLIGCSKASTPPAAAPMLPVVPPGPTTPEVQRGLRAARIDQGLAAHKKLATWLHALPERWSTGYSKVEKQLFLDAAADCVTTVRVGAAGDGGKWLCNSYRLTQPCVVYGFGAGPEISFEQAMAEDFGCEVHTFDPSQESIRNYGNLETGKELRRFEGHQSGVASVAVAPCGE